MEGLIFGILRYLILNVVFIWPIEGSFLELIAQNTMKDQQSCNTVSSCVILLWGYHCSCESFLCKRMNNNHFGYIVSFLNKKNCNELDF